MVVFSQKPKPINNIRNWVWRVLDIKNRNLNYVNRSELEFDKSETEILICKTERDETSLASIPLVAYSYIASSWKGFVINNSEYKKWRHKNKTR